MVKKVFHPVVAKQGKLRKVQKRPATKKDSFWEKVKYVREGAVNSRGQRKDQIKWKRTLPELLNASNRKIIDILIADKFLPKCKLQVAPRGDLHKHRCSHRNCHVWMNPHHLHPLFSECQGPQSQSLQMQAAHLLLKLHKVPQSKIHLLLGVNHKAIEDMENKLCKTRQEYVQKKEKEILLGDGKSWKDDGVMMWEQWAGIVQRGRPETLILRKLQPKITVKRAPGPGAIRKTEWKLIAEELLLDRTVILYTDSAKSYKLKLSGVLHDKVIRRHWKFLKERVLVNQHTKAESSLLKAKLRSAQYEYWSRNADFWVGCGELCSHSMQKFLS
ncbi:unnamed protein product [Symbiodinium pilosum]|uniref:Uncharacterized protein n=1 Tax=Symbiodinium pilosum TaxID=2952 RepID=A0A812N0N7_SYMPI|nr:unnamed protein product [Symbiodinium pilosum]